MNSSWRRATILPNSTIRDAVVVINENVTLRIALVIDEKDQLIGVVTDGDIRRALLNNVSLDNSVLDIMNSNPKTVSISNDKRKTKLLMEQMGIFAIPVVDDNVVIDVITYQSSLEKDVHDNPVFIMAGGFGTRLKPLTDNCPKPMLRVGGRPLLETLIVNFTSSGFRKFYISTHYMPEVIMNYFGNGERFGVEINYVYEDQPLGTGGALGLLPKDIPKLPIILINGDVLTDIDFERLLKFHNDNSAQATMCVREYEYQVPYGVITGDGSNIISMDEKPTHSYFINAGIYVIEPGVVNSVTPNVKIDMPTLLEEQINNKNNVLMFPIHEYWLDIGRMDDFNRAQRDYVSLGFNND